MDAMLHSGVLCSDIIRAASIEFHVNMFRQMDLSKYSNRYGKSLKSFQNELKKHAKYSCRDGTATKFVLLDDESYLHDGVAFPEMCT